MSFGGGSSGGGGTTQQTVTNQPPAYLQPFVEDVAVRAQAQNNLNPTQFFPGQTYVDQSPQTLAAINAMTQRGQGGSPLTTAAQNAAIKTIQGDMLGANPYADAQFQKIADRVRTNLDTSAARAGTGAADSAAYARALASATSDAATQFYGDQYGRERQLQMQAIGQAPGLAAQDYTDIAALGAAGQQVEQQRGLELADQMARYNSQFTLPRQDLANYAGLLYGANYGGDSSSVTRQQSNTNPFAQIAGGALAALPFLFSLSDRRAKTDIKKIGTLDNDLPVYRYRYKGDPRPMIGLMAQDVVKVKPEAVAKLPGGLLAVDYGKATAA